VTDIEHVKLVLLPCFCFSSNHVLIGNVFVCQLTEAVTLAMKSLCMSG